MKSSHNLSTGNPAFLEGQKAALDWLASLEAYQEFVGRIRFQSRRSSRPDLAPPPNHDLTKYLFGLLVQRLQMIIDSGPQHSLWEKWASDLGQGLHHFNLSFISTIHTLVRQPILYLCETAYTEIALKNLRKVLEPVKARYRRLLQQVKTDPILNASPTMKDWIASFCEGALFELNSFASKSSEFSHILIETGINKPLESAPHRQKVFDEMLVNLVDYLKDKIPSRISDDDESKSQLFAHVSKILSLAWGTELCPDKPKMWQERYRRAAP